MMSEGKDVLSSVYRRCNRNPFSWEDIQITRRGLKCEGREDTKCAVRFFHAVSDNQVLHENKIIHENERLRTDQVRLSPQRDARMSKNSTKHNDGAHWHKERKKCIQIIILPFSFFFKKRIFLKNQKNFFDIFHFNNK